MEIYQIYKNKKNGNILEIVYDESPDSPRSWDNLGIMICSHKRYTLGDIQVSSRDEIDEHLKKAVISLPIYMMDHSGISLRAYDYNDQWDSGQVGYIYVTKEKLKECYGKKITKDILDKAQKCLLGEIETYSEYLNGQVFGYREYQISTCDHNEEHKNEIDSCYGYYGDSGIEQILSENDKDNLELIS